MIKYCLFSCDFPLNHRLIEYISLDLAFFGVSVVVRVAFVMCFSQANWTTLYTQRNWLLIFNWGTFEPVFCVSREKKNGKKMTKNEFCSKWKMYWSDGTLATEKIAWRILFFYFSTGRRRTLFTYILYTDISYWISWTMNENFLFRCCLLLLPLPPPVYMYSSFGYTLPCFYAPFSIVNNWNVIVVVVVFIVLE